MMRNDISETRRARALGGQVSPPDLVGRGVGLGSGGARVAPWVALCLSGTFGAQQRKAKHAWLSGP